jgi:hypothetical protein
MQPVTRISRRQEDTSIVGRSTLKCSGPEYDYMYLEVNSAIGFLQEYPVAPENSSRRNLPMYKVDE